MTFVGLFRIILYGYPTEGHDLKVGATLVNSYRSTDPNTTVLNQHEEGLHDYKKELVGVGLLELDLPVENLSLKLTALKKVARDW